MKLDKRKKSREVLHVPITEMGSDGIASGMIINLSEGGLCYYKRCSAVKNNDNHVGLSFVTTRKAGLLEVESSVVYRQMLNDYTLIGVAFNDPTAKVKEYVHNHLNRFACEVPMQM